MSGEVLVRVRAVGICGSDVHYFRAGRIGDLVVAGPLILGHECAGEVVALGPGVQAPSLGQAVAVEPGWPCCRCPLCKMGKYHLCRHLTFLATPPDDGALCEYLAVPADFAHLLPTGMSMALGAMVEPLAVGVHAARQGDVRPGDTVVVFGAGPIGLSAVMAARGLGAHEVYVVEPDAFRRQQAPAFGASAAFEPSASGLAALKGAVGGRAAVVLESSGAVAAVQQAAEVVGPGGRVVIIGFPAAEVPLNLTRLMAKEATIRTVWRYVNDFPLAIQLVARGLAPAEKLITHRYPLDKSQEAMEAAGKPGRLKALVELK
jgi:L-iditol 2-dehydrogenase